MMIALFIFTLIVWTAVVIFATMVWVGSKMISSIENDETKHRLCVYTAYQTGYDDAKIKKGPRPHEAVLKVSGWNT